MRGVTSRFVDRGGEAYDVKKKRAKRETAVGFFSLWRYATSGERLATALAAALATVSAVGMVSAVVAYGELTSLFVQRHRAAPTTPHAHILKLFGGGDQLEAGDRDAHMDALVRDSVAFLLASVAIMAVQLSAATAAVWLANWAAGTMVVRLRARLLRAVLRQEDAFFDTAKSVNFAAALTEEMDKLQGGVGEHVAMTAYLVGTAAAGGALALVHGWQLTLAALAVAPLQLAVAATVAKHQTAWSGAEVAAYGVAGRAAEEALAGVRTVRAHSAETHEVTRYARLLGGAGRAARRRGNWAALGAGLGSLLTYSLNAIVFAYGAALCVRDMDLPPARQQYHPGVMVIVLFCSYLGAQNISLCLPHLEMFSAARGAAAALFPLLERRSRIDPLQDSGLEPERFRGDIAFDGVHFSYPSRPDVKVLRGLSLSVAAGETVALVGGSGCGKSTVLQLLQRLYEPSAGAVTVDGHRLADLHLNRYRTSIGVVGQEPVLFAGTVRENIALGAEGTPLELVVAAARAAHAHGFISKLPQGYDTALGERCALSGGQKQRVALARALLRNPPMLLLDEPTSALDPVAERQVQAALDAASAGRTTLVVSHRLSTLANASRIVVMERGAVVEQGAPAELLARRGAYWRLVQDDLAHKSVPRLPAAGTDDDEAPVEDGGAGDDAFPAGLSHGHFQRAGGALRESVRSTSSGCRVGAAPHMATAPPDLLPPPYTEPVEPEGDEKRPSVSTWRLLRLNAPEWPLLAGGALASFLVGGTMPTFAFLLSKLYGMFAWSDGEAILEASRAYAGGFAGAAALCGLAHAAHTWLFNRAGAGLTDRLRELTFRSFLLQEQAWFDEPRNSVGALCARLAADCAAVQGATGSRLGTVVQGVSTMVLGVGLAAVYSWKMTLVSLLSVPFVIGGICLEGWASRRAERAERRALEAASRLATEAVLNVRTVHALGVERSVLARYGVALAAGGGGGCGVARGLVYGVCLCAPTFGYAVSLAYGGYLIAREDLSYEHVILVSEALIYGAWMLAEALSFAPSFTAARRAGARIVAQLERAPGVTSARSAPEDPTWISSGEVKLDQVEFRYPSRPRSAALRGLSLVAAPGRTLALVGPSGSGKSTVLQLLLRNYDVTAGTISLDGRDIKRDLTLHALRSQLALVQQEPVVFARSLRENIAYGSTSDAPLPDIIDAAKQANIHNFITSLPQGYDTVLSSGCALSGGQKQRVCIARALLRRPRLLLLDEATSALDANSEKVVQSALEEASRGRTTLTIAHRLATITYAHLICVVHNGTIAESGSHEELLRRRGLYWELWQQQAPAS